MRACIFSHMRRNTRLSPPLQLHSRVGEDGNEARKWEYLQSTIFRTLISLRVKLLLKLEASCKQNINSLFMVYSDPIKHRSHKTQIHCSLVLSPCPNFRLPNEKLGRSLETRLHPLHKWLQCLRRSLHSCIFIYMLCMHIVYMLVCNCIQLGRV